MCWCENNSLRLLIHFKKKKSFYSLPIKIFLLKEKKSAPNETGGHDGQISHGRPGQEWEGWLWRSAASIL